MTRAIAALGWLAVALLVLVALGACCMVPRRGPELMRWQCPEPSGRTYCPPDSAIAAARRGKP